MLPERRRQNYVNVVLIPLLAAAITAWSEHRSGEIKDRQDATYAVTAPALRDIQIEQAKLAARVDMLTQLVSAHVMQHPRATVDVERASRSRPVGSRRISSGSVGLGGIGVAGSGAGIAAGQDQLDMANKLKSAPSLKPVQRSIPDTPEEALHELKK